MASRLITEIRRRKAKDEYAVFIDGEHAFDVDAETLWRLGLKAGQVIGPETEEAARREAERSRAKSAALRLLTARPRSAAETRGRLLRAGFAPGVVDEVVRWLKERGYLDDEAFARGWVDARTRMRPMGARRMELELLEKGVAKDAARAAVAGVTREQEEEWAAAVAGRRLARLKQLPPEVARRRLYGFLERRGFRSDVIRETVSRLLP